MAGETILIVEDNLLNRKLVEAVLQPHGYRLLAAMDGKEAIEIANRERPDLILMDLGLPDVSGYETVENLKAQPETMDIPVIALTAYAMPGDRERALASGCDGYLTKPIDTRAFPSQIREYLDSKG